MAQLSWLLSYLMLPKSKRKNLLYRGVAEELGDGANDILSLIASPSQRLMQEVLLEST
jgi:hypothetical protein